MKQFAKAVSIFGGIVVLVMVGMFAVKAAMRRSAQEDANMRAVLLTDSENAVAAVYNEEQNGEIVTIPDEAVITEEYQPPQEEAIPLRPGTVAAPDTEDTAQTAKFIYDRAEEFLTQEQNKEAVQALLMNELSQSYILDASQSEGLAAAFFSDFLGAAEYQKQYAGCRVGFHLKNGEAQVQFASGMKGDIAAAYAAHIEEAQGSAVKTEVTEVTVITGLKKVIVTTTVVTTTTPDGTDVKSSVSSRTA